MCVLEGHHVEGVPIYTYIGSHHTTHLNADVRAFAETMKMAAIGGAE